MIDEYWEDISIYYVGFYSRTDLNTNRPKKKIIKILAFPSNITKKDVFNLVPLYFHNIEEVLYVDEIDSDGLLLKKNILT